MSDEPGTLLATNDLTPSQVNALRILAVPVLAQIKTLEALGYLPAIRSLPGVGLGAHCFSETRYLLEQTDHLNGEHALYPQLAQYLLEAGLVKRTREEYDHHVTITPRGLEVMNRFAMRT